jgi:hypothetical protein
MNGISEIGERNNGPTPYPTTRLSASGVDWTSDRVTSRGEEGIPKVVIPNVLTNSDTPKCSAPIDTAGDHIAEAMYTVVVMIMIVNNVHAFFPNVLKDVSQRHGLVLHPDRVVERDSPV